MERLWQIEVWWTKFDNLSSGMDFPSRRRRDVQWLMRNLMFRNSKHPNFNEVIKILRQIERYQ